MQRPLTDYEFHLRVLAVDLLLQFSQAVDLLHALGRNAIKADRLSTNNPANGMAVSVKSINPTLLSINKDSKDSLITTPQYLPVFRVSGSVFVISSKSLQIYLIRVFIT